MADHTRTPPAQESSKEDPLELALEALAPIVAKHLTDLVTRRGLPRPGLMAEEGKGDWRDDVVRESPALSRGIVWCTKCGLSQAVDSALCLVIGWPKHCGYTMTIDSPEERAARTARPN